MTENKLGSQTALANNVEMERGGEDEFYNNLNDA